MSTLPDRWYHDTVSALAYSLAQPHANPATPEMGPPHNDLTRFVLRQQAQMPDFLRLPMLALTLGFDVAGLVRGAQLFHRQSAPARERQVQAWRASRLSLSRDWLRYYESLATFALYSRPDAPACPVEPPNKPVRLRPTPARIDPEDPQIISTPPTLLRPQIAVVGSGPGGAITACLLREAGLDVLMVEEGGLEEETGCAAFSLEEMLQKYRNGGQTVALGRNKISYVEGCCVGGGSEINSGLYHRTPPEVLERWQKEFRVAGLGDLNPHFEACERDLSVSLLPGPAPVASLKLHEGAERLHWKSIEVPRWFRYEPGSAPTGTRQSMTQTFLPRFLRAGGRLLPRTRVGRLRRDGSAWTLNATHPQAGSVRIQAEFVFLCAGAIQTAVLLRRSGITRNVGNSLQLHPTVKVTARFPEPVNSAQMGVPVHQVKEFAPRLTFGCSISTPPYLSLGLLDHPSAGRETRSSWTHLANYYAMTAAQGSGTIRVLGTFKDALVRYRLSVEDRRNLAEGLRKLSEVLFAAGAVALHPSLVSAPQLRSPADLRRLPEVLPDGLASLMTIHLFSSCPMGEDQTKTATDSFGQVWGAAGLFINDASLLCTAPGVNPQGTIMALARRNAAHFLEHRKHLRRPTP